MKGFDGEKGRRADLRTRDRYPPPPPNNTIEENGIMNVKCPKCEKNAYLKHHGQATKTLIGGGAGGYAGWTAWAAGGAKTGALVGSFFAPVGREAGATVRQQSVMGSVCCR